jgi:hypothetical protein
VADSHSERQREDSCSGHICWKIWSKNQEKSNHQDVWLSIFKVVLRKTSPRLRIILEITLANVHVAQKDCQTCRAAIQSGDSHLQEEITYKELKSIEHTGTWKEITDPEGASLVDSKCVFQIKLVQEKDKERESRHVQEEMCLVTPA